MTDQVVGFLESKGRFPSQEIIDRYLAGISTIPEQVAMDRWISENPEWKLPLSSMEMDAATARRDLKVNWESERFEEAVIAKLGSSELSKILQNPPELSANRIHLKSGITPLSVKRWIPSQLGILGAVLCIALVSFIGFSLNNTVFDKKISGGSEVKYSIYSTGNGQRSTVSLADGSNIVLNVGTHLYVPTDYDSGNRRIILEGEALFEVKAGKKTPFSVVSGTTTTRVLGTSFVVRNYRTDSVTTVTVRSGKVSVGDAVVSANQKAKAYSSQNVIVSDSDETQFGFERGILVLNSQLLVTAIPELNRWYDVDIRLGDSILLEQRVNGEFKVGSKTDLISVLKLMYDVRIVSEGRVLTLYSRGRL